MPMQGVLVSELLRKADPITAPKLAVIRDYHSTEDETTNWAVDQLVRAIRHQVQDVQVADKAISLLAIFPHASNDPDSDRFQPGDQFPLVWDTIREADVVIFSCQECAGFPSSKMVMLAQRLCDLAKDRKEKTGKAHAPLFDTPKVGVIVVNGGSGVEQAATVLSHTVNKMGFVFPRRAYVAWNRDMGDIKKSTDFGECVEQLATDIVDLCKALH